MKTAQKTNLAIVQQIYGWFGEGNIPAILEQLTADVVWIHAGNPAIMPFAGKFHGKEGALEFFQKMGQSVEIPVFEPFNFSEKSNQILNDVKVECRVKKTGKSAHIDSHFSWTFNEKGKVTHWEMKGDTRALEAAFS